MYGRQDACPTDGLLVGFGGLGDVRWWSGFFGWEGMFDARAFDSYLDDSCVECD